MYLLYYSFSHCFIIYLFIHCFIIYLFIHSFILCRETFQLFHKCLLSVRLSDSDVQVISVCLRFGHFLFFLLVISNAYTFRTQYNRTVSSAWYLGNETYCNVLSGINNCKDFYFLLFPLLSSVFKWIHDYMHNIKLTVCSLVYMYICIYWGPHGR